MISLSQDTHTVSLFTAQNGKKKKKKSKLLGASACCLEIFIASFLPHVNSYELSHSECFQLEKMSFFTTGLKVAQPRCVRTRHMDEE